MHSNGARLSSIQNALKELLWMLEPLLSAANGTVFDSIPFCVYIAAFYVLARKSDAHHVSWWRDKKQTELLYTASMAAWPYEFDESERTKIKSGVLRLYFACLIFLTTWLPGRANVFDSADAIKEI